MIVFNSCFLAFFVSLICSNKSLTLLNFTINDYYQSNGRLHFADRNKLCDSNEEHIETLFKHTYTPITPIVCVWSDFFTVLIIKSSESFAEMQ